MINLYLIFQRFLEKLWYLAKYLRLIRLDALNHSTSRVACFACLKGRKNYPPFFSNANDGMVKLFS